MEIIGSKSVGNMGYEMAKPPGTTHYRFPENSFVFVLSILYGIWCLVGGQCSLEMGVFILHIGMGVGVYIDNI